MKNVFLFTLTLMEALVLRFSWLPTVPPLIDRLFLNQRLISALLSVGISVLIYFYIKKIYGGKLGLLSMFFFVNLPWTVEQGRMSSEVNNFLFVFMIVLLLRKKFGWIFLLPAAFWLYPSFWLLRLDDRVFSLKDFINNIFLLISPEFLFFKNPTFWWGGVRETGIMPFILIPIFIVGLYRFFIKINFEMFFMSLSIMMISALSPRLPESREFFLITPFISLLLALGINTSFVKKNLISKVLFYFLFILIVYDFSQFLHDYFIHYPKRVLSNVNQIHEPF